MAVKIDPNVINVDIAIDLFWIEDGSTIEGASSQLHAAKYYLLGKGISIEVFKQNVDKIKSKLAGLTDKLAEKEKNKLPTPPASSGDPDPSYQVSRSFNRCLMLVSVLYCLWRIILTFFRT